MPSGWWSFTRLISIEVKPNTALVTCPLAVAMSVGSAKNARYVSEFPSRRRSFTRGASRTQGAGEDPLGDIAHPAPLAHRGALDEGERVLFAQAALVDEDPLRAVDDLAR